MLDHDKLAALLRETSSERVLSVYLSAADDDFAQRTAWRVRLDGLLDGCRAGIGPDELDAFDRDRAAVEDQLAAVAGFLPGRGWVAFVAGGRVRLGGPVPAPVPDRVRWATGAVAGPALRVLKQARPVVLALADSRRGRVFRYSGGALEEVADLRADTWIDDLSDSTSSKRAATSSGARGETGTDAADRMLRQETTRFLSDLAHQLLGYAGNDGTILLAGPADARAQLRRLLTTLPPHRVDDHVSLPVTASDADIREAVEAHASHATDERLLVVLRELLDDSGPGGRAVVGLTATRQAVDAGQVDKLLITHAFALEAEADVESLLARCVALGGTVESVGGEAASLLAGHGVAARLRFPQAVPQPGRAP